MNKKIFITGVSGFIGRNLAKKLIGNNQIYALVSEDIDQNDKKIKFVKGDLLDPNSFNSIMKACDVVFHCAAHISFQKEDFQKSYQVNVEGTRNILEAAYKNRVKKIVHLSACAVLGYTMDKNTFLDETSNPKIGKDNVYAYTKKLAEEEIQKYVQKGLNVSIANTATVYGQGDRKLNSGTVIKSVYEGKMKLIPPGGTSFVSVDDLVEGLVLLAQKGKPGERYIFCTENMEYKALIQRIAKTLKLKETSFVLPRFSYYPALLVAKGIESFSSLGKSKINLTTTQILKETYGYKYFSSKKAKEELEWRPVQSFEEAVKKAFNYYKENLLI